MIQKAHTHNSEGKDSLAQQQAFLNELDARLWKAADQLRNQLDAANYKHIVLGFIFLKYISDSFSGFRQKLLSQLQDPKNLLYLGFNYFIGNL